MNNTIIRNILCLLECVLGTFIFKSLIVISFSSPESIIKSSGFDFWYPSVVLICSKVYFP